VDGGARPQPRDRRPQPPRPTPRIAFPFAVYSHRGGSFDRRLAPPHQGRSSLPEISSSKETRRAAEPTAATVGGGGGHLLCQPRICAVTSGGQPGDRAACSCYACRHDLPLIENTLTVSPVESGGRGVCWATCAACCACGVEATVLRYRLVAVPLPGFNRP
jgi:hypothetical protein